MRYGGVDWSAQGVLWDEAEEVPSVRGVTSSVRMRTETVIAWRAAARLASCDLDKRRRGADPPRPTGFVCHCPQTSALLHPLLSTP